jgi:hypothetical protein
MSFFENIIKKLFPGESNSRRTLLHEVILRKKNEQLNYAQWLESELRQKQVREIKSAYTLRKHDISSPLTILIYNTSYSNGFALTYNKFFSESEFRFIFDYFRDKVLDMGYKIANSDRKIREKPNYIETREKHYLKPPINYNEGINDQKYGNILIEHISIDDKPDYIKVMANVYSDRYYSKPESFEDFMEKLFED